MAKRIPNAAGETFYRLTPEEVDRIWGAACDRVALKDRHKIRNLRIDHADNPAWTWYKGLAGEWIVAHHGKIPYNLYDHTRRGDNGVDLYTFVPSREGWKTIDVKSTQLKGSALTIRDGPQWPKDRRRWPLLADFAVQVEIHTPQVVKITGQVGKKRAYEVGKSCFRSPPHPLGVEQQFLEPFDLFHDAEAVQKNKGDMSHLRQQG